MSVDTPIMFEKIWNHILYALVLMVSQYTFEYIGGKFLIIYSFSAFRWPDHWLVIHACHYIIKHGLIVCHIYLCSTTVLPESIPHEDVIFRFVALILRRDLVCLGCNCFIWCILAHHDFMIRSPYQIKLLFLGYAYSW